MENKTKYLLAVIVIFSGKLEIIQKHITAAGNSNQIDPESFPSQIADIYQLSNSSNCYKTPENRQTEQTDVLKAVNVEDDSNSQKLSILGQTEQTLTENPANCFQLQRTTKSLTNVDQIVNTNNCPENPSVEPTEQDNGGDEGLIDHNDLVLRVPNIVNVSNANAELANDIATDIRETGDSLHESLES